MKKSLNEIPMAVERELSAPGGLWPDVDANSTASSSKSEDKVEYFHTIGIFNNYSAK